MPPIAAPSSPATRYRIAPLDPHAHLYEVRVTVDTPDRAGQKFVLPTWIPGSYLIREFARHFVTVRGEGAEGAVAMRKVAKDTWQADPCAGPLTLVAHVYAFDLSVRAAYLDATRGYFNGPSVFPCPVGHEHARCVVDIAAPADGSGRDWRVATTLARAGADEHGFGLYEAADYDELIDHPVETGAFALARFEAGGVPHEIAIAGRQSADLERLATDLRRVCQWQVDLFGGAPFPRYLFQVAAVGDGYGGLEHRSSTSLLCRRDELPAPGTDAIDDDYLRFLGLASHEYFHAWNVKRIMPAAFAPYNLARENYTRQLWAFEGFTSYYDDLALVRCGLIGPERYLELLGQTITTVLRAPGRHLQSVADSSFDAWIKYYRPDENSPNSVVSYYTKGALVGCALDLTLRLTGRASLDILMRALWERFGKPGIGVPEDAIAALASELAGRDLADFFARYVEGTEDPPLADLFAQFGIAFNLRGALDAKDRGGKAASLMPPAATLGMRVNADQKVAVVFRDGPAARAGLSAGDTLVAIDGLRATPERLQTVLRQRAPGSTVALHAFRRDEFLTLTATLAPAPADTCWLALDPGRDRRRPPPPRRVAARLGGTAKSSLAKDLYAASRTTLVLSSHFQAGAAGPPPRRPPDFAIDVPAAKGATPARHHPRIRRTPFAVAWLRRYRGVERVAAGDRRLREDVPRHRRARVRAGEARRHVEARHVEREQREYVAVRQRIVPRRTRAVVAVVIAGHLRIAGEPPGVVVDPVARVARRMGPRLAARLDAVGMLAARDPRRIGRKVDERPVEEVDARQRCRYHASLLVHVVAARRHVRIVADERERARAMRQFGPREVGIAVGGQTHVRRRVDHAERELAGNHAVVRESRRRQFHRCSPRQLLFCQCGGTVAAKNGNASTRAFHAASAGGSSAATSNVGTFSAQRSRKPTIG